MQDSVDTAKLSVAFRNAFVSRFKLTKTDSNRMGVRRVNSFSDRGSPDFDKFKSFIAEVATLDPKEAWRIRERYVKWLSSTVLDSPRDGRPHIFWEEISEHTGGKVKKTGPYMQRPTSPLKSVTHAPVQPAEEKPTEKEEKEIPAKVVAAPTKSKEEEDDPSWWELVCPISQEKIPQTLDGRVVTPSVSCRRIPVSGICGHFDIQNTYGLGEKGLVHPRLTAGMLRGMDSELNLNTSFDVLIGELEPILRMRGDVDARREAYFCDDAMIPLFREPTKVSAPNCAKESILPLGSLRVSDASLSEIISHSIQAYAYEMASVFRQRMKLDATASERIQEFFVKHVPWFPAEWKRLFPPGWQEPAWISLYEKWSPGANSIPPLPSRMENKKLMLVRHPQRENLRLPLGNSVTWEDLYWWPKEQMCYKRLRKFMALPPVSYNLKFIEKEDNTPPPVEVKDLIGASVTGFHNPAIIIPPKLGSAARLVGMRLAWEIRNIRKARPGFVFSPPKDAWLQRFICTDPAVLSVWKDYGESEYDIVHGEGSWAKDLMRKLVQTTHFSSIPIEASFPPGKAEKIHAALDELMEEYREVKRLRTPPLAGVFVNAADIMEDARWEGLGVST